LENRGPSALTLSEELDIRSGYFLNADTLHLISRVSHGLTSSIALFGPKRRLTSDVFSQRSLATASEETRRPYDASSLAQLLDAYLTATTS
jgi:hypothetical protein